MSNFNQIFKKGIPDSKSNSWWSIKSAVWGKEIPTKILPKIPIKRSIPTYQISINLLLVPNLHNKQGLASLVKHYGEELAFHSQWVLVIVDGFRIRLEPVDIPMPSLKLTAKAPENLWLEDETKYSQNKDDTRIPIQLSSFPNPWRCKMCMYIYMYTVDDFKKLCFFNVNPPIKFRMDPKWIPFC